MPGEIPSYYSLSIPTIIYSSMSLTFYSYSDAAIAGFHAELALSMRNSRFFPEPPAEPTIEENLFDFRRDFFQELNQKMESLVEKPSSNNDVLPQPVPDQNILATHEPTTASMTRIDAEKMIFEVVSVMDGGDIALLHSIFYCLASENRKAAAAATAAGVNISEASSLLAGSSQQNLMVQHGQWDVAEDLTVGRSRGNDACLPDLSVSKQHAVLSYFHNVGLVVRDCGSKHGTFVDGVQVKHGQSPMVVEGTQLRFGRICCEVKRLRQAAVLTSGFQPNAELRKLQAEALRKQQLLQIEKDKKLQPRATSNESSSSSHRNGGQKRKLSTSCNVHDATEAAAAGTKEAVQPISSSTEWREEGSKLMRKMGWDGSAALGSYTSEQPPPLADAPVNAVKRKDRAGLGTESAVLGTVESLCTSVKSEDVLKDEAKERQRSMMIARFKELDKKHSTGFFEG